MPYSTTARNNMLDLALDESISTGAKYLGLHSAWPGASGTTAELSGGSPAYARKSATWAAASSAAKAASSVTFDVPAATTVGFFSLWDASTSGTFLGTGILGGSSVPKVFTADTSDLFTSPSHGFTAGNTVVFLDTAGTLPTGITEGTVYYVISSGLTTDAFKVSATSGGSAVDLTAAGVGLASAIVQETFAGQGTYTLNPATIDLLL